MIRRKIKRNKKKLRKSRMGKVIKNPRITFKGKNKWKMKWIKFLIASGLQKFENYKLIWRRKIQNITVLIRQHLEWGKIIQQSNWKSENYPVIDSIVSSKVYLYLCSQPLRENVWIICLLTLLQPVLR